jgi:hypothetical protein
MTDASLVCDPAAISPERRERWAAVTDELYRLVEEVRELPHGFALRLPTQEDVLALAAEEMNFERLCCPFLRMSLEVEPNSGPSWLHMTGDEGVKQFLRVALESHDKLVPPLALSVDSADAQFDGHPI